MLPERPCLMPLTPGQQFLEYHIDRLLGRGSYSLVYLAHDTASDRLAAIKELTVDRRADEAAFDQFLRDAGTAGRLGHPNIVALLAVENQDQHCYVVTEYLAGGDLSARLRHGGPLPVDEAVRIAADVCAGLAAAHASGIIHRDVRPSNILFTEDGRAKLADFGIAHVPLAVGSYSMTHTGFEVGSLIYMSPEQLRGDPVDERSDIYQLGAVLYEMLTGQPCVDLEDLMQEARRATGSNVMLFQARLFELIGQAVCEREPPGLAELKPAWLRQLLGSFLAKSADGRPTADALGRALQNGLAAYRAVPAVKPETRPEELAPAVDNAPTIRAEDTSRPNALPGARRPVPVPVPVLVPSGRAPVPKPSRAGRLRMWWLVGTLTLSLCILLAALVVAEVRLVGLPAPLSQTPTSAGPPVVASVSTVTPAVAPTATTSPSPTATTARSPAPTATSSMTPTATGTASRTPAVPSSPSATATATASSVSTSFTARPVAATTTPSTTSTATGTATLTPPVSSTPIRTRPGSTVSPVLSATVPATPVLVYTSGSSNLRDGPATTFPVIALLEANTPVLPIERTSNNLWWHVRVPDRNLEGWIHTSLLSGMDEVPPVPTASVIPPSPTPAPTASGTPSGG